MQQAGQEGLALGQGLDRGRSAPRSIEKGKLRPALLRPKPGGKGWGRNWVWRNEGPFPLGWTWGPGPALLSSYRASVPLAHWTTQPPNLTVPAPEEGARPERAVDREPGRVRELRVGTMVRRGVAAT